jgi:hypothetical protein
VAFEDALNQTCRVERPTRTEDAWGDESDADAFWQVVAEEVACRLIIRQSEVRESDTASRPTVTLYRLLVEPDTDVQVGDRIADVREPDGTTQEGVFHIEAVMPRWKARDRHHIALDLRRVH